MGSIKSWIKPFVIREILINEFSELEKKIRLIYRSFDYLMLIEINEITQYALGFFLFFLRSPNMCHTNAIIGI